MFIDGAFDKNTADHNNIYCSSYFFVAIIFTALCLYNIRKVASGKGLQRLLEKESKMAR